ncbi:MAG: hypothetical protein ACI8XO_004196, partial [Verrucomicrobiales bacterium]
GRDGHGDRNTSENFHELVSPNTADLESSVRQGINSHSIMSVITIINHIH